MDPFAWVERDTPPTDYMPTWINHLSYLAPMRDGAVLHWVYDDVPGDGLYVLVARLTEDEAQRVFDSPTDSGMLESVRADLSWRGALMFVYDEATGEVTRVWRYVITPDLTEEEFVDDMMNPPPHLSFGMPQEADRQRFLEPMLAGARSSA